MCYLFEVTFRDKEVIEIEEVFEFNEDQKNQLMKIASETIKSRLNREKYGTDIILLEYQKKVVLDLKEEILIDYSSEYLYSNQIVCFGKHPLKRILERVGSDSKATIIYVVDKLKLSDTVYKAQWKGYPQFTYTLISKEDLEKYKLTICFENLKEVNPNIRMITISNIEVDKLNQSLSDNPTLLEMKERIKNQFSKK